MPINIYRREADNSRGNAISALANGVLQGQQLKQKKQQDELNQLLLAAKVGELTRKTEALGQPAPERGGGLPLMPGMGGGQGGPLMPGGDYETSYSLNQDGDTRTTFKPLSIEKQNQKNSAQRIMPALNEYESLIDQGATKARGLYKYANNIPLMPGMGAYAQQKAVDSGVPFLVSGDKMSEDLQGAITRLKADIPFTRGGKALTPTESSRIDALLNTAGKSDSRIKRDIQIFQQEFAGKAGVMPAGNKKSKYEIVAVD